MYTMTYQPIIVTQQALPDCPSFLPLLLSPSRLPRWLQVLQSFLVVLLQALVPKKERLSLSLLPLLLLPSRLL